MGNIFILNPYEANRSILLTESAFLKEREEYVMSVEIQNGDVYREIFMHNQGTWIMHRLATERQTDSS